MAPNRRAETPCSSRGSCLERCRTASTGSLSTCRATEDEDRSGERVECKDGRKGGGWMPAEEGIGAEGRVGWMLEVAEYRVLIALVASRGSAVRRTQPVPVTPILLTTPGER
ncbi:hypothetical protein KM043_012766 [Ampulex compressa]|nr:hypothetical protein KM043_012766 [Ampulex compressa]